MFSSSPSSTSSPSATPAPLPDLAALRARVDALAEQRQRVLGEVRRRITSATEGQGPSERSSLDNSILSSALSKVEEEYTAKLREFPVTLDTVAARAEAVAPPGGERCPCLRRCLERSYVLWGEAVLGLLLAATGVERKRPSSSNSSNSSNGPFSAAKDSGASGNEGVGERGDAETSSRLFASAGAAGASK